MTQVYENKGKKRLKKGEKLSACWVQMGSSVASEIVGQAGFDIAVIDAEHAPLDATNVLPLMQSLTAYDCMPMVRAPWNDFVQIKRLLDCGAMGVHIPYVRTAAEAEEAVQACKYPPEGTRGIAGSPRACGYGRNRLQYMQHANDEVFTMVAIETLDGANCVEEMCNIKGLDGIFIGPMDLATNMGYFAQPGHPEVQKKIREIEKIVLEKNMILGSVAANADAAQVMYERGYSYVIFASDTANLAVGLSASVTSFKEYSDK